jgi:hypothetical protein
MQRAQVLASGMASQSKPGNAVPSGSATDRQTDQNDEAKAKLLAGLSAEELSSCRISERLGRLFSAATEYENKESLTAAFDEATKVFPVVKLAYKPSGKTTPWAVLAMIVAAPILLVLMTALAFGLCWAFSALATALGARPDPTYMDRANLGKVDLLLDLILVIGMTAIPLLSYGFLSKITKNRNPRIPAVLTAVVNVILAVILFVPIWHGETLAPTHISFFFIPIRWVLIVIGGALVPIIGVLAVHHTVSSQRFCEVSGRYLKKFRQVGVSFDYAENALALLNRGEYVRGVHLPTATAEQLKAKHCADICLWWHEQAQTAYLELEIKFHGKLTSPKAAKREDSKKEKSWLAYARELNSSHAEVLARAMAA